LTIINIDKIQMKRGNRATIPTLDDGEPAICLDTKEFAIGTPEGNLYFSFQDFSDLLSEVGNAKGGYTSLQEKLNSLASSGGGTGVLVYQTLADLQTAYPNGTTQPAWIVGDNAWYYWSGAVADTTAPTVTMSPAAGLYNTSKSVTLTANETATIYYTTDGSTPTTSSTVYSTPISISATTTLKYFAKDTAGNSSTPQTAVFTIDTVLPVLTITAGGTFTGTKSVTMSATDASATTIYYTLDGSTPTTSSAIYSSALSITATTTVKAFAKDAAGNSSAVQTVTYTLDTSVPDTTPPTVNVSPAAGTYNSAQSVTLSTEAGATIYYTTDGSTPTTSSTVYSTPISISASATLKFIGRDTAGNVSTPVSATYNIDTSPPVVTSSPAAGTYTSAQSVTLSSEAGATIYYTTNGTTPTTASTVYTAPISISATTTLQFIGKDTAGNISTPVAATYTINLPDTTAPVLTITPAATFTDTQTVTMSANETATIWYTVDGTDPTTSGTKVQYSSAVTLTATTTVKAYAVDSANNASAVQTVTYTKQISVTITDSFNRADSTSGLGNTETGQAWQTVAGTGSTTTWGIVSGQAYNIAGQDSFQVVDSGVSDCTVQVKVTDNTNKQYSRLIFRFVDNANYYMLQSNSTNYQLYKKVTGTFTALKTIAVTPAIGDVLKVVLSGSTITPYINGVAQAAATDAFNSTATKHGIGVTNSTTNAKFDDFSITS
jgi:hypothetical protein